MVKQMVLITRTAVELGSIEEDVVSLRIDFAGTKASCIAVAYFAIEEEVSMAIAKLQQASSSVMVELMVELLVELMVESITLSFTRNSILNSSD